MKKLILLLFSFLNSINYLNAQWQPANTLVGAGHVSSIAVKGSTVFAGTLTGGVYLSTDNGSSWLAKNNGLTNMDDVRSLVTDGSEVFAGVYGSMGGTALFATADNGATWIPKNLQGLYLFSLAWKPGYLFAGTWFGVKTSTDGGATWGGGLTGLPSNASVGALVFNGSDVFAGVSYSSVGGTGIFVSTDNGGSWNSFNSGTTGSKNISAMASLGTDIFAVAAGALYKSPAASANWVTSNTGLTAAVLSLHANGGYLFAGTMNGMFLSADTGATWTNISTGLPANTKIFSVNSDNTYLYAGTDSAVWRRLLSEVVTGINDMDVPGATISIYPNPLSFSSVLQVNTEVKDAEAVIYDMLGKEMMRKKLTANRMEIEKRNWESGVYFVTVSDNERQYVRKIIVD